MIGPVCWTPNFLSLAHPSIASCDPTLRSGPHLAYHIPHSSQQQRLRALAPSKETHKCRICCVPVPYSHSRPPAGRCAPRARRCLCSLHIQRRGSQTYTWTGRKSKGLLRREDPHFRAHNNPLLLLIRPPSLSTYIRSSCKSICPPVSRLRNAGLGLPVRKYTRALILCPGLYTAGTAIVGWAAGWPLELGWRANRAVPSSYGWLAPRLRERYQPLLRDGDGTYAYGVCLSVCMDVCMYMHARTHARTYARVPWTLEGEGTPL